MGLAPKTELIKHWHERQAALGQAVLHLRWYLGVLNALDKTIGDQTPQRRGERLVSSRRKLAFELVVARRAVQVQAEQNWQLVLAFYQENAYAKPVFSMPLRANTTPLLPLPCGLLYALLQ